MNEDDEKLTGFDYLSRPLVELQSHPDFSEKAYRNVAVVGLMRNEELERIGLYF